jgi:hypothetical protein
MKSVNGRGPLPSGVPHRIVPSLRAIGVYDGIEEPHRRTGVTYDVLRRMASTHIVRAIIQRRIGQVCSFARIPRGRQDVGFVIERQDPREPMTPADRREARRIEELILNGGYLYRRNTDGQIAAWDGRGEERAKRFDMFLRLFTEDSLVMDAGAFRLELPSDPKYHPVYREHEDARERGMGSPPVWIGNIDGATIRRTEQEHRMPEDRELLTPVAWGGARKQYEPQIVPKDTPVAWVSMDRDNHVQREFTWYQLAYCPRNIASDEFSNGYGRSELEWAIELVTGLISGVGFNTTFFTNCHIPPGMLMLTGGWQQEFLEQFQGMLTDEVGGMNKWHQLPVLFSEESDAAAQFISLREQGRLDMHWEKWVSFLVNVLCSLYGMAAEEIGFQSFRGSGGALQESDPASRILHAQDTGFVPYMWWLEDVLNTNVVQRIDRNFALRWQGLQKFDESQRWEVVRSKMETGYFSVNEARSELGDTEIKSPLDVHLYQRIERATLKQYPELAADRSELNRMAQQIYEHKDGKWCIWPNEPGMPTLVSQLVISERMGYIQSVESMGMDAAGGAADPMAMLGQPGAQGFGEEGGQAGAFGLGSPEDAGEPADGDAGAPALPAGIKLEDFLPPQADESGGDDDGDDEDLVERGERKRDDFEREARRRPGTEVRKGLVYRERRTLFGRVVRSLQDALSRGHN